MSKWYKGKRIYKSSKNTSSSVRNQLSVKQPTVNRSVPRVNVPRETLIKLPKPSRTTQERTGISHSNRISKRANIVAINNTKKNRRKKRREQRSRERERARLRSSTRTTSNTSTVITATQQDTATNDIADSRTLIYDSIRSMIEDALDEPRKIVVPTKNGETKTSYITSFHSYLAYYLQTKLEQEILTYGDKAYMAMENCGDSLIEECRTYIYDSTEDLEQKKARMLSILYLIRGAYTDEDQETSSHWQDALDDFEDL